MMVRQVRLQAPATNTTQDFTVSGLGTPDWCLVMWGGVTESAWSTAEDSIGIGAFDGTNQYCVGMGGEDGQTPNGVTHCTSHNARVVQVEWDSVADRRYASAAFITDGVRLTWGGGSTAHRPYVTVIMGWGGTAKVGWHTASAADLGTSSQTGLTITPKLLVLAGRQGDTIPGESELGRYSIGFAVDNGVTIDQCCKALRCNDTDPMDFNAHVSNSRAVAIECSVGGAPSLVEITGMSSGQFDTQTHGASSFGSSFMYFALETDGEDIVLFTDDTPTAAGDYDPFTSTFTPQWVFMLPTAETTLNSNRSGGEDVVEEWGLYSVIDATAEEFGHYNAYENGATGAGSTLWQGRSDERLEINTVTTSAPANLVAGAAPTFDASGIVYADANFSHNSSARWILGFAVEEPVSAGGGILPVMMQQQR